MYALLYIFTTNSNYIYFQLFFGIYKDLCETDINARNGQKKDRNGQNWTETDRNRHKLTETVRNGQKWTETDKKGQNKM